MADVNQQLQNVEWQDSPQPSPKKTDGAPTWILVVLGVVVGVAVVVLGIFIVRLLLQGPQPPAQIQEDLELAETNCLDARDSEACVDQSMLGMARETGDAMYCDGLEGTVYDDCIGVVAIAAEDVEICRQIRDNDVQEACVTAVRTITTDFSSGSEACDIYPDEDDKALCLNSWEKDVFLNGDCRGEGFSEAECEISDVLQEAREKQDASLCSQISSPQNDDEIDYRDYCVEVIIDDPDFDGLTSQAEITYGTDPAVQDSDGDGLLDGEEVIDYGTDPTLADTDGDGFDDKTEIDNGFDPLA